MKRSVYNFLNKNLFFTKFIYGLIVLNVVFLILESYEEISTQYARFLEIFEFFSVMVFSVEYVLRFWTSDLNEKYAGGSLYKRFRFFVSTLGLIDLVAILPFYLPLFLTLDLRIVRILRLFRLLRIFKLGRYSTAIKMINDVLKESKSELAITVFVAFILLIFSSTLMFYIEHDAQPENFASIGHAVWWAVATLTTVGYGDVYPITAMGKVLSAIIALVGIGFVALPTGIISSAFIDKISRDKEKKAKEAKAKETEKLVCNCPSCGAKIEVEKQGGEVVVSPTA